MRLEAIKIRHLGPFRDFAVDLADYEGQTLIAVTGPNGAGKSTLLELGLPGALYRSTPTRGSLQDLSTARDSMLEVRVVNGQAWTLRHLVDPVSGKSEALVLDADGRAVLDSSKVRDFDRWVERHLPPPEVLFASVFGAQGSAGFLGMRPGERKAVLLRALGLERLETLAAGARAAATNARSVVSAVEARLDEFRRAWPGADMATLQAAVHESQQRLQQAEGAAAAAEREVQFARASAADAELAHARWQENLAKRNALEAKVAALLEQRAGIETKLANNRAVLADADAIRDAVDQSAVFADQLRKLEGELVTARHALRLWEHERLAADREAQTATQRLSRVEQQLVGASAVLDLAATLPEAVAREAEATARLEVLALAVSGIEAMALTGAEDRLERLREGLETICAGSPEHSRQTASDTLAADDQAILTAAVLPAELLAAREAHSAGAQALAAAARARSASEAAAARVPAINVLQEEQVAAIDALAAAEAAARSVSSREPTAGPITELERQCLERREIIAKLDPLVRRAVPLANAEGRIAELEPQLEQVLEDHAAVTAELAAIPNLESPQSFDLGSIEQRLVEARKDVEAARKEVFTATAKQEAFAAAQARSVEVEAELAAANAEVADWVRLSADLGRDGLQAAEIDAAGPELTALVNDLLHTCIGPRWTVSIETTRLSADGKRQLEGCDVRVIDTEGGRDAEASTYSGGERVILGEAVSLALAMLSCRRAGLLGVTLVRDESGAALDPANARAYVQMLRRAAQLIGARHVLFVSHSPEVVEMADARIEVTS